MGALCCQKVAGVGCMHGMRITLWFFVNFILDNFIAEIIERVLISWTVSANCRWERQLVLVVCMGYFWTKCNKCVC